MVYLQKHSEEIYWLNRRIQFLKVLDELIDQDVTAEEAKHIARQFVKVENPIDLVARLKEIYGEDLQ